MNLLARLLCLIGLHSWSYRARDNHMHLTRRCQRCRKQQQLMRADSIGPTEYWSSAK